MIIVTSLTAWKDHNDKAGARGRVGMTRMTMARTDMTKRTTVTRRKTTTSRRETVKKTRTEATRKTNPPPSPFKRY